MVALLAYYFVKIISFQSDVGACRSLLELKSINAICSKENSKDFN